MGAILVQIVLLDIVFSLDSVLTAVGMVDEVAIMIAAVVIAVGVMLVRLRARSSSFVHDHPSVKILALSFLLLIGVTLVADGFGLHIDKAYIYSAMGFSVFVEALNLRRTEQEQAPGRAAPDVRQGRDRGADRLGARRAASAPERGQERLADLRRHPQPRRAPRRTARGRRGSRCRRSR